MNTLSPEQHHSAHIAPASSMNHHTVSKTLSSPQQTSYIDRLGIALSGLCAVHCLVLPLALPFMGTLVNFIHSEWTHILLAILIIPTVVFTAWRGYKHHGKREVLWLLGIGTLAVLAAIFVGEQGAGDHVEAAVTTLGSVLLITGHWQNHKHCSLCASGKPHIH